MDYGTVSDLVLRLEKGLFSVGSKETVNFTIHCPENAKTIKILDEKGKEVATVENQGEAQVSGSIEINESEPRFGSLHAVSENLESQEIYFTVAPEITEVMLENLGNVCVDIHDYLVTEYPDGKYTDDAPAKIRQFLEQDKRVGNVRIDEKMILFQTIDGLMGMVDTSENEGFVRGTVSKEKAYALSREGQTDEETVIPERSAVTNTRYLYVSPVNDDPIINYGDVDPREYLEHMASEFGAHYEFIKNDDAETVMKDGSFTNAGFTVLSTHGHTFTRENGGKLLLMSMHNYLDSNIAETQGTKYNEEKKKELLKSLI